jgi:hypothetical protein
LTKVESIHKEVELDVNREVSIASDTKEVSVKEHLILARIKGELHPYAGAIARTSGE